MDQALLEEQAKKIALRVGSNRVSIGMASVISILISVIPQVISCWNKEDEADPAKVNAAIKAKHDKTPVRLQRQTAIAVRKKAPRGEKPSAADAQVLAQAMIAEACEAAPDRVATVFARCCA